MGLGEQAQQRHSARHSPACSCWPQILSKMPVVAPLQLPPAGPTAPPLAGAAVLECAAAAAAGAAAAGGPSVAGDWVPPCAALRHLQPAKLAVYQALVQQGLSVQQVAARRHIQEDSVQVGWGVGLGLAWHGCAVPALPVLALPVLALPVLAKTATSCGQWPKYFMLCWAAGLHG